MIFVFNHFNEHSLSAVALGTMRQKYVLLVFSGAAAFYVNSRVRCLPVNKNVTGGGNHLPLL
jgi:hypothetical protein